MFRTLLYITAFLLPVLSPAQVTSTTAFLLPVLSPAKVTSTTAFLLPVLSPAQVTSTSPHLGGLGGLESYDSYNTFLARYDSLLRVSMVGIEIYDLTADTTLFAYNEHQNLHPASTMKLTTAIAALDILGGDYKFLTSMKVVCPAKVLNDKTHIKSPSLTGGSGWVSLIGGMDPLFDSTDMHAFISALRKQNIDTIQGAILEDKILKDTLLLGSGWCWDDKNPSLTPLLYNGANTFLKSFRDSLAANNIAITPSQPSDTICTQNIYNISSHRGGREEALGAVRYVTRSHTIDEVLVPMLKNSNNLYAEAIFYQLSPTNRRSPLFSGHATNHPTAQDITKILDSLVVQNIYKTSSPSSGYREGAFADGSGLSPYNYQTANYQVRLLRYAYQHPEIYQHLYPALSIAGTDGTLKNRMTNTLAQGNVHAKTGSLTGVSALAGYLTAKNGHILCFSIINQGCLTPKYARDFQDNLCIMMCQ